MAFLLSGCVYVTEPLSDATKAEPDKRLLGKWERQKPSASRCEIDSPAVKNHPKGLLRMVMNGRPDDSAFWFFTTTIGRNTYANIYLKQNLKVSELHFADFRREGAFEKWTKGKDRRYFIFRYVLDGNNLTVDGGAEPVLAKLMKTEKIKGTGPQGQGPYQTPKGWFAKYLAKNGPEELYDGTNVEVWRRAKK
jgi:hypothetical protein